MNIKDFFQIPPNYATNKLKKWQEILILIATGLFIGFVNGFLGAGGGILLVPILTFVIKEPTRVAHSTAVAVILPLCLVSGIVYWVKGCFQFDIGWKVFVGTVVGGIVGTFVLKKLQSEWINLIFAIVMIVAGVFMII